MRAVIQRTMTPSSVVVDGKTTGAISKGLIVYLGVEDTDEESDIIWLSNKIVNTRIFSDDHGKMNLSVKDIDGEILIISQFTLFASTKKGNRPSYLRSGKPDFANSLYTQFIKHTAAVHDIKVSSGIFGADMKVNYTNDGPVTIVIDTKSKE